MPIDLLNYMIWHNTCGKGGQKTVGPSPVVSVSDARAKPAKSVIINLPIVQEGSGDPSPENVRAITPWSSVKLSRTGENFFDATKATASTSYSTVTRDGIKLTVTGQSGKTYCGFKNDSFFVRKGVTYTVSGHIKLFTEIGDRQPSLGFRNSSNNSFVSPAAVLPSGETEADVSTTVTFASSRNVYISGLVTGSSGSDHDVSAEYSNIQLVVGSSAPSPYVDFVDFDNYTLSFDNSVYGGYLDVVSGVLTVTHQIVDLGDYAWTKYTALDTPCFSCDAVRSAILVSYRNNQSADIICSAYKTATANSVYNNNTDLAIGISGTDATYPGRIFVRDNDKASLSTSGFREAMAGIKVVYPLKTPVTYQLTPQQVDMLAGKNNLFSNAGNVKLIYV